MTLLAQVGAETLASGFKTDALPWIAALLTIAVSGLALYVRALHTKVDETQEKRVSDRDQFQKELKELAQGLQSTLEKNTQGLFLVSRVLEERQKRKPQRLEGQG